MATGMVNQRSLLFEDLLIPPPTRRPVLFAEDNHAASFVRFLAIDRICLAAAPSIFPGGIRWKHCFATPCSSNRKIQQQQLTT
jgi:hypothetical protein